MNERRRLIRALERAIIQLRIRAEDPATSQQERAEITARLAELEAQLAELQAQAIADAANDVALVEPDEATVLEIRRVTRRLNDAVVRNRRTSALLALADTAVAVLTT